MRNTVVLTVGLAAATLAIVAAVTWGKPFVLSWWTSEPEPEPKSEPKTVGIDKPEKDVENDLEIAERLRERRQQNNSETNPGRNPNALNPKGRGAMGDTSLVRECLSIAQSFSSIS